jgi:hypothetical protein
MKPLTIELASGLALELRDQIATTGLTGRIAATLRLPAQTGQFTRAPASVTFAGPHEWHVLDGDRVLGWSVTIGNTHIDLDGEDQAELIGYWLKTYEAAYAQQRAAARQVVA